MWGAATSTHPVRREPLSCDSTMCSQHVRVAVDDPGGEMQLCLGRSTEWNRRSLLTGNV